MVLVLSYNNIIILIRNFKSQKSYSNNNNNGNIQKAKTVVKLYYILDVITRIIFYYVDRTKLEAKHVRYDTRLLHLYCSSLYSTTSAPNEQICRDNSDATKYIE